MKYRLLLAVMALGILGAASFFVYAQTEPDSTATPAASSVIQEDIFVRGGPGRDYLPVGKLLAGDRVRPLSRNATSDWVLIVYGKNYGWIRRDLAFWVENIDALPVMDTANLTPSPVIPTTPANTPVLAATETPSGNWVELSTDAQSGYVRGGPGRTYLRLGQLYTGDAVEPVSRNEDGTWVMIRFGEGFGWISRNLVRWIVDIDALPVISVDNLTPTATFTATETLSSTSSYTPTATATVMPSATPTLTPTITPSETATNTPEPSVTPQPTLTATIVPSETPIPTATSTATTAPTATVVEPSTTPQPTLTATIVPSETPIPTATSTATTAPTVTVVEPSATSTAAPSATPLPTETSAAAAVVPSATVTLVPTNTATRVIPTATQTLTEVVPSSTPVPPTRTQTVSVTATLFPATATSQPLTATSLPATAAPTDAATVASATLQPSVTSTQASGGAINTAAPTLVPEVSQPSSGGGLPAEAIIAGIALLGIVIYGFFYWRGLSTAERYANGFVIDTCPVCGRGHLIVEARQERLLGVPRVRHSVRCSECRSVLREVGEQQWRYAVDPMENPELYEQYNGRIISDDMLATLGTRKQSPPG